MTRCPAVALAYRVTAQELAHASAMAPVGYLGIGVDDALELAEQTHLWFGDRFAELLRPPPGRRSSAKTRYGGSCSS